MILKNDKALSLFEIILTCVVVGVLAVSAMPNVSRIMERSQSKTTMDNMLAIQSAQETYREQNGTYCLDACAASLSDINTNLKISIPASNGVLSYNCILDGTNAKCLAQLESGTVMELILSDPVNPTPKPVYCWTGGAYCNGSNFKPNPCCTGGTQCQSCP